jgi:hypothetical protein
MDDKKLVSKRGYGEAKRAGKRTRVSDETTRLKGLAETVAIAIAQDWPIARHPRFCEYLEDALRRRKHCFSLEQHGAFGTYMRIVWSGKDE